jgi:phage terminase small subunit
MVKDELKKYIESMQKKLLSELEHSATYHSTRISELEAKVGSSTTRVAYLVNRCKDMEIRMQRNSIRLLGMQEEVEGPRPMEFTAQLLQELLSLEEKPLLDRAHCTLRS